MKALKMTTHMNQLIIVKKKGMHREFECFHLRVVDGLCDRYRRRSGVRAPAAAAASLAVARIPGFFSTVCLLARRPLVSSSRAPHFATSGGSSSGFCLRLTSRVRCVCVMRNAGSEGTTVPLDQQDGDVLFGRDESCNIRIQKPAVSTQHAKIFWQQGLVRRCRDVVLSCRDVGGAGGAGVALCAKSDR